jgi:hypothetical protein
MTTLAKSNKAVRRVRRFLVPGLCLCAISIATALARAADVDIRYMQNGETVSLAKGDTLVVRLPIKPGSYLSWAINSMDADKLKIESRPEVTTLAKPGGPVFQVFRFDAIGTARFRSGWSCKGGAE